MFGFGKKKYSETPWKTATGEYKCQSEVCPPDMCGSGKCPLDVYTNAMQKAQEGDVEGAMRLMAVVLAMAPDFAEAWFNVGCLYGNIGDHTRARDAFRTALRLKPEYPQAKAALDRAECHVCGGVEGVKSIRYMDILDRLLDEAVRLGDMREKIVKHVPELICCGDDLGRRLLQGLREDAEANGMEQDLYRDYQTAVVWSVYAGFGAVLEWNADWPGLKAAGLVEKLTAERGFYAMDEYVVEMFVGERYDTDAGIVPPACKTFSDSITRYAQVAISQVMEACQELEGAEKANYVMASLAELTKGCYQFGMALALEKVM